MSSKSWDAKLEINPWGSGDFDLDLEGDLEDGVWFRKDCERDLLQCLFLGDLEDKLKEIFSDDYSFIDMT